MPGLMKARDPGHTLKEKSRPTSMNTIGAKNAGGSVYLPAWNRKMPMKHRSVPSSKSENYATHVGLKSKLRAD
jgi:hypothetical protein